MAFQIVRDTQRPVMAGGRDGRAEARSQHQFARLQIALDDYDDVLADWVETHIGAERAQMWGIPDTSSNVLADISRQLSTPGLYGKRPPITHASGAADGLIGIDGLLDSAGWLSTMPWVQYLTECLSDVFVGVDATADGLIVRIIYPHDVYLVPSEADPSIARAHWELHQRYDSTTEEWLYYWNVWDVGVRDDAGVQVAAPSFRVFDADGETDQTHRFFADAGRLAGDAYPWRTEAGLPIIPRIHYQDSDSKMLWNTSLKRGIHQGTLNAALYWTYVGHCARDSTGSYVMVAGLDAGSYSVIDENNGVSTNPMYGSVPSKSKTMGPGSMEFFQVSEGQTPWVYEVGPGANLDSLRSFADQYEMKQATRMGLSPSDLSRTNANPSSAAALMVSNEGKREFSRQAEVIYRPNDLALIELAAIVARDAGLGTYPQRGYSIQYVQIPRTPTEENDFRADLDWQLAHGQLSQIGSYQLTHPGTTKQAATAALVLVAEEERALAAMLAPIQPTPEPEPEPEPSEATDNA